MSRMRQVAVTVALVLVAASCGGSSGDAASAESANESASDERPTVVVTTNILGDVVENLIGDQADVVVIMPVGSDPHDFQASAQQVAQIGDAGTLVVNGASFEEGLLDVIESAEADGVPVFEAISAVETIEFDGDGHEDHGDEDHDDDHDEDDDHGDEDHDDEDHGDEDHDEDHGDEDHDEDHDEHAHDGADPHFFTDPVRMAESVEGLADFLAENVEGIDVDLLQANAEGYVAELQELDLEIAADLAVIPQERRILVTNHEVFGYFADRYDFDIVGTVVPGGSTVDSASAQVLVELAEVIRENQVPAIFADTSSSNQLAETLAAEVGDVAVVELYTESLGDADSDGATYIEMVRSNSSRIVEAFAG